MAKTVPANDRLVLAIGKEDVLVGRVIEKVISSARAFDPQFVRLDISASAESAAATFANAMSPSLFGEFNVVVVDKLDEVTDELAAHIESTVNEIPEHVSLLFVHPGGVKGKRLLDIIRKAGALEASCSELKGKDLVAALTAEFKRYKRKVTTEGLEALQSAVGPNLSELLSAISQLCSDVEADVIDAKEVHRYYEGIGEVKGYEISDLMWNRQPVEVLEKFRWALENDPGSAVPVVMAIAGGLRSLVKFATAPAGMTEGELAGHCGVPPWKIRDLRAQKNKWTPEQLANATQLLALADRYSKGTQYDPEIPGGKSLDDEQKYYLLEQALLGIRPITS